MERLERAEQPGGSLRARFQPSLLTAAVATVLPVLVAVDAPWPLVALYLGVAGVAIVTAVAARVGRIGRHQREQLAWAFTGSALLGFNLALFVAAGGGVAPVNFGLLAASLLCALVAAPARRFRSVGAAAVVVPLVAVMVWARTPPAVVLHVVVVLVATVAVAWSMADALRRARRDAFHDRAAIERRTELLQAVRALPTDSFSEAATHCCAQLGAFGADAAGVSRVDVGALRPVHLVGLDAVASPVPRGVGVQWRAIEEDRTVVVEDYPRHPDAIRARDGIGRCVAVPLRTREATIGSVFAAWRDPGPISDAEVELVEVLGAHLGAIAGTDDRVARQAELLVRLEMLDRLRRDLLGAMSEELRDPLTVLRGVVQVLGAHADRLDESQRVDFLQRLEGQTTQLRRLVDGVLDFSRSQRGEDPAVVPTELAEVLAGLPREFAATEQLLHPAANGGAVVVTDAALVRAAIGLLMQTAADPAEGAGQPRVVMGATPAAIHLRLRNLGAVPDLVHDLVASLVRTAGAELRVQGELPTIVLPRFDTRRVRLDARASLDAGAAGGADVPS